MEFARQIAGVIFVLGLLVFVALKLGRRRLGPWPKWAGKASELQLVDRLSLTQQHALHIVRVHGREILVATHPQGCTPILQDAGEGKS